MTNKELIKAFRQGGEGNCVSIAIIKAGIEIFGLDNIFHHQWNDDGCKVVMRDGVELKFSKEEFELCYEESGFILLENKDVYDYAVLCFTAMAKRAQQEENDRKKHHNLPPMTFPEGIESLNNGDNYLEGPHWLGLRHHVRSIGRKHIWQYKGVIGGSSAHCFFASKGLEDKYGKIDKIGPFERRFCKWFRVTVESIH